MAIINRVNDENALMIGNEQIGRTLSIGSNWTWLRIAILAEISYTGSADIASPRFALGLSAGTGSMFLDSGCRHFVGFVSPLGDNWLVSGNVTQPSSNEPYIAVKSGSLEIKTASLSGGSGAIPKTFGLYFTSSTRDRGAWFVDYMKSNTDPGVWQVRVFGRQPVDAFQRDVNTSSFYAQLPAFTASLGAYAYQSCSIAVSESVYGALDTINIAWNCTSSMAISEVAVYRFA